MKPENKEKVIEVLKRNRRYVAMIGDGVNDVKSLKSAQVGVALESGSGAARGVADMVLVNDQFSALPKALVEGRRTVSGIRDILKLYLSRNFALAIMFIAIFFFLGNVPLLPIQNMFYAFVSVSVIAFFMTIFAKPSENKELILPEVLRFCLPSAITIGFMGVILYVLVWFMTDSGIMVLDFSYLENQVTFWNQSVDEIANSHLVWNSSYDYSTLEAQREMAARNCMVLFASVIGALQLLIVCPRYKFLSMDGRVNKSILPIFLEILVLGAVFLMYSTFPEVATFAGMLILPDMGFAIVLIFVVITWILILLAVKKDLMKNLVNRFEVFYHRKLDREYTKGDVVDVDGGFKKPE